MPDLVKRTVLVDGFSYSLPGLAPNSRDYFLGRKGEEIEVEQLDADRGESVGALGSPEELPPVLEADAAAVDGRPSDDELARLSVAQIHAYLTQNPSDLDRVERLENEREKPRSGVLDAVNATRSALAESGQPQE